MLRKDKINKGLLILYSISVGLFLGISILAFMDVFGGDSFFEYYDAAPHILIPFTVIVLVLGFLFFLKLPKDDVATKKRDFYLLGGLSLTAFLTIAALLILLVYYGRISTLGYVLLVFLFLDLISEGAILVLIIMLHNSREKCFENIEQNKNNDNDKFRYAAEKLKEIQTLKNENIIDDETYENLKQKYIKML